MLRKTSAPLVYIALLLATTSWSSAVGATGVVASQQTQVRIRDRQVIEPATQRLVVTKNTLLNIHWHSDEAGTLHVHGYDINVRLQANATVSMQFLAKATGRFAVTSHGFAGETDHSHGHRAMLYIEVHPD